MTDSFFITIRNFDKYMGRSDIKNCWWFKMSNSILSDPEIFDLTGDELRAFLYVLCVASKKRSGTIELTRVHAMVSSHVEWPAMLSMVDKMVKRKVFSRARCKSGRVLAAFRPQSGRQIRLEEIRLEEIREIGSDLQSNSPPQNFDNVLIEKPSIHWLAELWNVNTASLSKVTTTSGKRLQKIGKRINERSSASEWEAIILKVEASDFLSGRNGKWQSCSFDWLLGNDQNGTPNHIRVFEGIHDNKTASVKSGSSLSPEMYEQYKDWGK